MDNLIGFKEILEFYRGKKVFITGHTGFKGSWLSFLLMELGANVRGYALKPHDESHFKFLGLEYLMPQVYADIRDFECLKLEIDTFKPDIVIHLAAQALVRKSYDNPRETFETNLMGSVNLLEAVKSCESIRSLVFITSDKCYENVEWVWGYRENDALGGHDPYSASKAAAEIAFSSYSRSFFLSRSNLGVASARAGNVIGGGDWSADRIIPDCIRAAKSDSKLILRNPNSTRPWQHVLEPLSGYLMLGYYLYRNPESYSGSWNFGPDTSNHKTVYQVATKIIKSIGSGSIEIDKAGSEFHEARLLQLNCDKAHQLLGWLPRWHADESIDMTADWYRRYLLGEPVVDITKMQLLEYFKELK
ncbi:MAG: hypothetical protein RLZ10_1485 [Bacteroidota bacterium]